MFIEDDNLVQREELISDTEERKFSFLRFLIIVFIWLIWTAILTFIFLPKVQVAVKDSGVIELINNMNSRSSSSTSNQRLVSLSFYSLSGMKEYATYTEKRGSSLYHDAIEALLEGPNENALKDGSITYINENTKLIGLSFSKGICYVELSNEFLNSEDIEIARNQVISTLSSYSDIKKVEIIVDGTIL